MGGIDGRAGWMEDGREGEQRFQPLSVLTVGDYGAEQNQAIRSSSVLSQKMVPLRCDVATEKVVNKMQRGYRTKPRRDAGCVHA